MYDPIVSRYCDITALILKGNASRKIINIADSPAITCLNNLEKEKLSKALEILINQIDDIQLNDKYNRMLEINKAILWLNSSVNIELVLAKIAKALGR